MGNFGCILDTLKTDSKRSLRCFTNPERHPGDHQDLILHGLRVVNLYHRIVIFGLIVVLCHPIFPCVGVKELMEEVDEIQNLDKLGKRESSPNALQAMHQTSQAIA